MTVQLNANIGVRGRASHDSGLNGQSEQEMLAGGAAENGGGVGTDRRGGGQVDGNLPAHRPT